MSRIVLPIKEMVKEDSITISYHESFDGKICISVGDTVIFDTLVKNTSNKDILKAGVIKRTDFTIMRIVLNDVFYVEEILEFYHPHIRILYEKEKSHLTISYSDLPPIDE
jgi:hypothetical protein